MYVIFKYKLPLLAVAFSVGLASQVSAVTPSPDGCPSSANAQATALCRDRAVMRDYALGLTSEPLVRTPPVSLSAGAPAIGHVNSRAPLSLLSRGLLGALDPAAAQGSRFAAGSPASQTNDITGKATRAAGVASPRPSAQVIDLSLASPIPGKAAAAHGQRNDTASALRRYVALGDFAVPSDAIETAQTFDLWHPRIQHVYINGRHYSRVLVGPFSDEEIEAVQKHLDGHGFSAAWPLRATADATPETLIARYPGDG